MIISAFQYPDGGPAAARHLALASGLLANGNEVSIILLNQVEPPETALGAKAINWTSVAGQGRTPLKWRMAAICGLRKALASIAAAVPIDAVILTGLDPLLLQGGLHAARSQGLPVLHELTEYPDVVGSRGIVSALGQILFERRFMPAFDGMLVISNALDEYVRQWTHSPVQIVGALVDTAIHEPLPPLEMTTTMVVGYAGSLSQAKDGVLTLLSAVAKIVPLLSPGIEVRVEVMGDELSPHGQRAVDLVQHLGIQDHVTFHGLLPHAEVRERLKNCHVLALPRPDSKQARGGFPTKLGEYLSTGRPVITTAVGDIPLYLRGGENCLMVQHDVDEIAEALISVARNYPHSQSVGLQGRKVVQDSFNATTQSRKVTSFVQHLYATR